MKVLNQGDRVSYRVNGRKMKGAVADILPFKPQREVPIKKRKNIVWISRKDVRKLPDRQSA